ncbi:MAG: porphobilinogen synthase [Simkania negevensis]|nr:porphobilinogen synthase [Simkania negevensis]
MTRKALLERPRRNRKSPAIRNLLQETHLLASDLIYPFFVLEGEKKRESIEKMAGTERLSIDLILKEAEELYRQGIQAIALFPVVPLHLRDLEGSEGWREESLIPRAIQKIKQELPSLCLIADIALDPFTSHGHDGIIGERGEVENDLTVEALCKQALLYARAGADVVAPSDMMDGRVEAIRKSLDEEGFSYVSILSYTAKYASSFYYPFRSAINTRLLSGDKKGYQMNPANKREAVREALLDQKEGADMLMIKPALPFLDVIAAVKEAIYLPVGAYHVSGEYAMVIAADRMGYLNAKEVFYESLLSIKRAGADFIFTYAAKQVIGLITKG